MSEYGFVLSVSDQTAAKLKQVQNNMRGLSETVHIESDNIKGYFADINSATDSLIKTFGTLFAAREIYQFGKEVLDVTAEFQGFENVIKYSSTSIADNYKNVAFLGKEIKNLHLPMEEAYQGFSELQAGLIGTGVEGDKLRTVFEGLSTAASVQHLGKHPFEMALYDFKEIGERGLNQRNWKSLVGWLPGIGEVVRETFHKSFEELNKEKMPGSEFLFKLGEGLKKHFEAGLPNVSNSLMAQINDQKTALTQTMLGMGTDLMPFYSDVLKKSVEGLHELQSIWNSLTGNTPFVHVLKELFDIAVKSVPVFVTYKATMAATGLLMRSYTAYQVGLTGATAAGTIATEAATVQVSGFGAALITTSEAEQAAAVAAQGFNTALSGMSFGAFAIGLGIIVKEIMEFNSQFSEAIEKLTGYQSTASKLAPILKSGQENWSAYLIDTDKHPLTATQKGKIYSGAVENKKWAQDALAVDVPAATSKAQKNINDLKGDISKIYSLYNKTGLLGMDSDKSGKLQDRLIDDQDKLAAALKDFTALQKMPDYLKGIINQSDSAIKDYVKQNKAILEYNKTHRHKKELIIVPSAADLNNIKDQAYSTSNLAGANGGLGQAKQVIMHFHGPIQQNYGVHDLTEQADQVVQKIMEMLDGFNGSQNSL